MSSLRGRAGAIAVIGLTVWTVGSQVQGVAAQAPPSKQELRLVELKEPDGQILSYRHLATSTDVLMRGTRRAPQARIRLKVGSRPGFVELDINRGGITGLRPAYFLGKDYLTYVLWAVSVDGKASNLGEITFDGDQPVAVNLTTPYQTFWLMVTAEPNYAVVDPSPMVVLYSVKQTAANDKRAVAIDRPLFYFTHYASYDSAAHAKAPDVPNQLMQARKALELASRSGLAAADHKDAARVKEQEYTREALTQAKHFLSQAESAYEKDRDSEEVVQFARTAAQSAENARALGSGAVGGLIIRKLESELTALRGEVATLKGLAKPVTPAPLVAIASATPQPIPAAAPAPASPPHVEPAPPSIVERIAPIVKQPATWFAVSGWALAIVLLFRRRSI